MLPAAAGVEVAATVALLAGSDGGTALQRFVIVFRRSRPSRRP
jgi:hypothetical protein